MDGVPANTTQVDANKVGGDETIIIAHDVIRRDGYTTVYTYCSVCSSVLSLQTNASKVIKCKGCRCN